MKKRREKNKTKHYGIVVTVMIFILVAAYGIYSYLRPMPLEELGFTVAIDGMKYAFPNLSINITFGEIENSKYYLYDVSLANHSTGETLLTSEVGSNTALMTGDSISLNLVTPFEFQSGDKVDLVSRFSDSNGKLLGKKTIPTQFM